MWPDCLVILPMALLFYEMAPYILNNSHLEIQTILTYTHALRHELLQLADQIESGKMGDQ